MGVERSGKLTYLPRVAKTSTRGILGRRGAWSWGEEEREKRRPIMFLIPGPSAWRVVVAARLLRPGSNYQRMMRRALNLLYRMNLHHRRTYWSVLGRVLGEDVRLGWFSAEVMLGIVRIDGDESVL
jgi:hypothetical protein